MTTTRRLRRNGVALRPVLLLLVLALVAGACTVSSDEPAQPGTEAVPEGCAAIDVATSPEKFDLLTDLGRRFNTSKEAREGDGGCAFVRVQRKSSGTAMQILSQGWPNEAADGPQPTVWSPAASSWGAILNEKLRAAGQAPIAPVAAGSAGGRPGTAKPFMLTPLVIAMPRPMAEALGWPGTPIGYGDILQLAQDPAGW
ncbi:MAG: substrate-binding domain-containing protein, partial [Acidimicrobiales bacterium]